MYIVHVLPVKEKKKFYKEDNFSTWESFLYFVLCPEYLPLYVKQETVDQLFFVLNIHDYSTNVHFYFFGNVMFLKIFKMLIYVVFTLPNASVIFTMLKSISNFLNIRFVSLRQTISQF